MLSNPYPTSSAGKSAAGSKSTPHRSRIVLLYSARLSRRTVTRPGSFGAVQSTFVSTFATQSATNAFSPGGGCGFDFGGIRPSASTSPTSFQS